MQKKQYKIIFISIFIVLASILVFSLTPKNILLSKPITAGTDISFTATADSASVYDFMHRLRKEGKISFVEKNYMGMGKFIVAINGVKGNGDKNWIYYVNGKKAQTGVSNYKLKLGDVVSWKLEKFSY